MVQKYTVNMHREGSVAGVYVAHVSCENVGGNSNDCIKPWKILTGLIQRRAKSNATTWQQVNTET